MEWKPASVAGSRLQGAQCSGTAKYPAVYTFGHGVQRGTIKSEPTSEGDRAAAVWWEGDHKPTTNEARNSDVADFWTGNQGHAAEAIQQVTGRDIAKQVKEAGRGSHVTLGYQGNEFTRTSKYKAEFCEKHEADGGNAVKAATGDMYFENKKNAHANKALGTGSSVNLSVMW
eukprot:GHRR01003954.1.p1 GENE.GHRR01003954.1~~GHRR01003954.1.p1  ORF type:complete len:172 (+),score=61.39 GHRR01003954.1:151-666(+)